MKAGLADTSLGQRSSWIKELGLIRAIGWVIGGFAAS